MFRAHRRPPHRTDPAADSARHPDGEAAARRSGRRPRWPRAGRRSRACCAAGRPAGGGRRPVLDPRPRRGPRVRRAACRRCAAELRGRAGDRDARLLREAAHHGRLEGPDQRPAPRRQLRDQRGPAPRARACCSTSPSWACRPAASSSTRSRRSTSRDLVAWGAIGARTTESQVHRELASGLSCRSASRTAPTATSRSRSTRSRRRRTRTISCRCTKQGHVGDRRDARQRGLPPHPARRQRRAELRRGRRRARACAALEKAKLPARADDRLQPRQQQQGSRRGSRRWRATSPAQIRRRRPRDRRRDGREPPGRRAAGRRRRASR